MPTLIEYLESRRNEISERISAELLSGNEVKLNQERAAEAELVILMDFLSSADYVKEFLKPSDNTGSLKLHRAVCRHCTGDQFRCESCIMGSEFNPSCAT